MTDRTVPASRRHGWTSPLSHKTTLLLGLVLIAFCTAASRVEAQWGQKRVRVIEGRSVVLNHGEKIQTVSLADDEVADVVAITSDELVVIGKKTGNTTLIVWGESLQYVTYAIQVDRNFAGQQIVLEVQIGEANRTALTELGLDWAWTNTDDDFIVEGDKTVGSFAGRTQTPRVPLVPNTAVSGYLRYVGDYNQISAAIRALQQKGNYKLMASPRLLCLSGKDASFLAGGEIPVPVAVTSTGGLQQVTIEWKEYGVRLNFTPTIIDSNLINLRVKPEVSSLDYNNAILLSGFSIPALLSRKADATVELTSGEALLLGGLVSAEQVKSVQKIPILGHIPLLGALFTRHESSSRENELIILVSPRVLGDPSEEPLPELPWDGKSKDSNADTTGADPNPEGGGENR
ncbi:MAG: pilus assembly protein N-terminal domain-containing protein [Candidatus Zixiibacteriota bacterium]